MDAVTVELNVTLDAKSLNGPSTPVVRTFAGDSAPIVLVPDKANGHDQAIRYTGTLKLPPVAKLTHQLNVCARSNYGGDCCRPAVFP